MKPNFFKKFFGAESGSILMLVGLSILFLFGIAGAGYDLGHQQLVRQKLQQACDASALAASNLPLTATNAQRQAVGLRYFALNYPASYLGVTRPTPTVTTTPDNSVSVSVAAIDIPTNFVSNLGISTLPAKGYSKVSIATSGASDYDVVMVVDESGSESGTLTPCAGSPYPCNREGAQQDALRTMANTIVPVGNTNQNVRMGFVGFSAQISNRWGLSNQNADALNAISNLRPMNQNFDHMALLAAMNMLKGGQGASNAKIGGGLGDYTINGNISMPNPRTARSMPGDAQGISNTKYVVFISDGGIMIEPSDIQLGTPYYPYYLPYYQDPTGLVQAHCPGRLPFYDILTGTNDECFAAFTDACTQLKNYGGTDNVHLFFINLKGTVTYQQPTLISCASSTISGSPTYPLSTKPDSTKDYYFANDTAALQNILKNITTTIQKQRILQ